MIVLFYQIINSNNNNNKNIVVVEINLIYIFIIFKISTENAIKESIFEFNKNKKLCFSLKVKLNK
jgi:hypothetical protein